MISFHSFYTVFHKKLQNSIGSLNNDIHILEVDSKRMKDFIKESRDHIELHCLFEWSDIISGRVKPKVTWDCKDKTVDLLDIYIKRINHNRGKLKKQKERRKKLEKLAIDRETFMLILEHFNQLLMTRIIKDGYIFKGVVGLGDIFVGMSRTKNPPINWKESYTLKAQLIEQGKVLYNQDTEPNGAKWLIRFDDEFSPYFKWSKYKCTVKNKKVYFFKPNRGENGNMSALYRYYVLNPKVKYLYKFDDYDS